MKLYKLIGFIYVACSSTSAQKVSEQLRLGNKYLQEGKYEEAILAFQKTIEIEPKNVAARIGLAKAYTATGKVDKAKTVLKEALDIEPKNVETLIELSQAYIKDNNVSEAEEMLKKVIEIESKNPQVYIELANIYVKQNKLDDAIALLEKGYELTRDESIKMLLDDLKIKSSNTRTQASPNTQNQGSDMNNYVVLTSGIKIYPTSKEEIDEKRTHGTTPSAKEAKGGIEIEIDKRRFRRILLIY